MNNFKRLTIVVLYALMMFPGGFVNGQSSPTYSISASKAIPFGAVQTPYAQPEAQTITITNTGTGPVTLKQPASYWTYEKDQSFEIGPLSVTTLEGEGATATFTVQPKAGLWLGTYNVTIAISGNNSVSATVKADFTIASVYYRTVMQNWNKDKDKAFTMAKEQDKFIILFVGHNTCPVCQGVSDILNNPAMSPVEKFVKDNYIQWFSNGGNGYEANAWVYVEEILAAKPNLLPLLSIVNPNEPAKNFAFTWGRLYPDALLNFFTIDLLADSKLKWYVDEVEALRLAKEQKKFIFKLEGKGTSPNSHEVIKLLNEDPLKKMLNDNYILLYQEFDADTHIDIATLSAEEDIAPVRMPYISIIYPDDPNSIIETASGLLDAETLEELVKPYTVANEVIASDNKVIVLENFIQISNRTNNEQIQVFTITGQQIANIRKSDYSILINASYFPKGVLIIHSSSDWSTKVLLK